jgi:hypothetical protein
MKASKMAVVRIPFEKVVSINQIGDDISANKPMFILVTGKIKGQEVSKLKSSRLDIVLSGLVISL